MYFQMAMNRAMKGDTFVSFDHADWRYRSVLECLAKGITDWDVQASVGFLSDNSVKKGDIDRHLSPQETMQIIQERHLKNAGTLVVLIGRDTAGRKFVDWEIAAALAQKCALHGILLPSVPHALADRYLPPRFADNLESGYATLVQWQEVYGDYSQLCDILYGVADDDEELQGVLRNNRPLFKNNRPRQWDLTYQEPALPPMVDAPLKPGSARRIRICRKGCGLPVDEVAAELGLHAEDYRRFEQEDEAIAGIRMRELIALARLLGMSPLALLEPKQEEWPEGAISMGEFRAQLMNNNRFWRLAGERWQTWKLHDENSAEVLLEYPLEFFREASYALVMDWRSVIPRELAAGDGDYSKLHRLHVSFTDC